MPIYEYRCPNGHVFEVFQRMSDPPRETCEICDAGPVEKVLYPVAAHFKGSGFYATDYGKSSRKRDGTRDGDGGGDSGETKTERSDGEKSAGEKEKAET